jgi:hypothetical protein
MQTHSKWKVSLFSAALLAAVSLTPGAASATACALSKGKPGLDAALVSKMLQDKSCTADLQAFTKTEHTDENIEFLLAVMGRKDKKMVYEKFISEKAAHQVNISSKERGVLDALAKAAKYKEMDFTDAHNTIRETVASDIGKRYVAWVEKGRGGKAPAPAKAAAPVKPKKK